MDEPVVIRFRWTADELLRAQRYHFRHTCRPVFRFGLHFIFGFVLFGGVLMLFMSGRSGDPPLPLGIGFTVVGIYWFTVRRFERRWWIRRQFRKRPDQEMEIEFQASHDQICTRSPLGRSEVSWQGFTKFLRTPDGVMLYPNEQMFHWLPRHGFASEAEFERFIAMAKGNIGRHYDLT